jgi:hypothetical protein
MGALVTLELADDAPQHNLPWIITFGPLDDDEDWEPVVCGPYERPHALALAQHLIADEDLMAVVEPLLPATSLDDIRAQIAKSQQDAIDIAAAEQDDAMDSDYEFDDEDFDEENDHDHEHDHAEAPTAADIRAGFSRISARLTSG